MSQRGTVFVVGEAEAWRLAIADALRPLSCSVVPSHDLAAIDPDVPHDGACLVVAGPHVDGAALQHFRQTHPTALLVGCRDASETDVFDAVLRDPVEPGDVRTLVATLIRLHQEALDLRRKTERLQLAQEAADIAVLDWVIPTGELIHSDGFLALLDLKPRDGEGGLTAEEIVARIHPDDIQGLMEEFAADSRTSERFRTEFRLVKRDGTIRWVASRGRFFLSRDERPERMLSLNFDITQRKEIERGNAELAAIVQSSLDAIFSTDVEGLVTSWNGGAGQLFALEAADVLGKPLEAVLGPLAQELAEARRAALADGAACALELRHTAPSGAVADLGITTAPVLRPDGAVIGTSFIMRDVSVQKSREDHIRFLMRELTHRSKNLLAVIQAMARQSMTHGVTPSDFVTRFSERLAGLAGSHDLLSTVQWQGASLMELIRSQLRHYQDLFGTRILLGEEDVLVRPEAAQNIGIALHELSTNAAKYGALSNEDGIVSITWGLQASPAGDDVFVLRWMERGGPPVTPPTRKGFGHIVMERITGRALAGDSGLSFRPEGLEWSLSVPKRAVLFEPGEAARRSAG